MSAYPIDTKAELFSALSKAQSLRHLPLGQALDASLELLANTLSFDIAILGKITGAEWQAEVIHGTSSLSPAAVFPVAELPCFATINTMNACLQENVKSPDAAFNYAVYLGCALIVDSEPYGTIHLGRKTPLPRPLSPEEDSFFLMIADSISALLEKRAAQEREANLRNTNRALNTAQAAVHMGYWYWDIKSNKTEWSEELFRVYGLEPFSVDTNYQEWLNVIAPEDKERANQIVWTASQNGSSFEMDWDTIHKGTGKRRHLTSVGDCIKDENGTVIAMFGTAQDITEKKLAQDLIRKNEEALRAAQAAAKLGHWRWDMTSNVVEWSDEYYRLHGYEPKSLEPSYELWRKTIAPEDLERMENTLKQAIETKKGYEAEYDIVLPTGERRSQYSVTHIECDDKGKVTYLFGIGQDITERKKADEAIRRSELSLKASQTIAKLGHWRWDTITNEVVWSEEMYRIYGYIPYSIQPGYQRWLDNIAPEDRERMHKSIQMAASGVSSYEGEYDSIRSNGERHSHYVFANVERDAQGNIIALFGIDQDITERKKLENTLRDRTRDLELAMEVSKQISQILTTEELLSHMVSLLQKSFNFYHVSVFIHDEEEEALVLQDASGEIGKRLKKQGQQFKLNSHDKGLVLQAARTRQAVLENDTNHAPNHFKNPYLPLTQSELAIPLVVGSRLVGVLDLQSSQVNHFSENELRVLSSLAEQLAIATENAHLYSQQAKVTQKLIQLDKLKSQFLANMSHELRTPLNAILNFSSFVAKGVYGEVNAEQEENLNKVIGSATHLLALINDILDLSKIEAGMMNLFIEDANMNSLFQSVMNTASGLARPRGVEFLTEVAPDLPTMKLDKRRIRQIFLNLLSNAFKFTQKGEVKLTVLYEDNMLMCSVSDTGAGIPDSELALIFEPFKQTDVGVSKGGTGLGLPISRYFAEAHGGKLWVESEHGKGTTFYVSLPVQVDVIHEN